MKYLYLFFLLIISNLAGAQTVSIIPQPVSIKEGKGKFIITKNTVIATRDEEDRKAASFLNQYLKNTYGFSLDIDRQESRNYIRITHHRNICIYISIYTHNCNRFLNNWTATMHDPDFQFWK